LPLAQYGLLIQGRFMPQSPPDFYNDLDLTFDQAWTLWVRGGVDRRSAFHTPVVATVDDAGAPQARVMVLRQADREMRSLRFHTDTRSGKVEQLAAMPDISVLGYDAASKIQLRVRGTGVIHQTGEAVEAAWAKTGLPSRKCYLARAAPGSISDAPTSGLDDGYDVRDPTLVESMPGRAHFSILLVSVDSIEWVYLAATGHRRARFDWTGTDWRKEWLVP
jgi:pyridoxamine 5'-phosphate oxidase